MRLSFWNKALAWKEWRQNRWKFWGIGVLMSMTPTLGTVFYFIIRACFPDAYWGGAGNPSLWSRHLDSMIYVEPSSTSMGMLAIIMALGLGALLIAGERSPNTLEFLAALPLSRKEIAGTKFLVGAGTILGVMVVNLVFMLVMALLLPAGYTPAAACTWCAVTTGVLLALYSLGFLVAVVTGNLLASLIGAFAVAYSPAVIAELIREMLEVFRLLPVDYPHPLSQALEDIGLYLTLPSYIVNYQWSFRNAVWLVPLLLLAGAALFSLGLQLFRRNPLERTGQVLMLGNARRIFQVGISFFGAALAVIIAGNISSLSDTGVQFVVFLGVFLVTWAVIDLYWRGRNRLG